MFYDEIATNCIHEEDVSFDSKLLLLTKDVHCKDFEAIALVNDMIASNENITRRVARLIYPSFLRN